MTSIDRFSPFAKTALLALALLVALVCAQPAVAASNKWYTVRLLATVILLLQY